MALPIAPATLLASTYRPALGANIYGLHISMRRCACSNRSPLMVFDLRENLEFLRGERKPSIEHRVLWNPETDAPYTNRAIPSRRAIA
jgi:hypothetical protein